MTTAALSTVAGAPAPAAAPAAAVGVDDVGALFAQHAPFLLRVVERLVGRGPHVEDIVQDVFIVAHRRRAELRSGPEVRGWLYRVAMNRVREHRRSLFRFFRLKDAAQAEPRGPGAGSADATPELVMRREQALRIRAVLSKLSFEQREVFVLHELEELPAREIAALLDLAEGTVWSRLSTARKEFRTRFEAAYGPQRIEEVKK